MKTVFVELVHPYKVSSESPKQNSKCDIFFNRHVLALKTGFEARSSGDPTDFQRLYHQQSDICMLHLFESFMESAPQLVLQLYIMVTLETWQSWTGECLFCSFTPHVFCLSTLPPNCLFIKNLTFRLPCIVINPYSKTN